MSYVDININFDYVEANIIINKLHNENIDCFLADKYSAIAAVAPSIITSRIFVNKKDFTQARDIIKRFLNNDTIREIN